MKYKKIIFLFSIFLPISILLRTMQLSFTIEPQTGFFLTEFKANGTAMLLVIFALCLTPAFFAFFSHRNPENPPKPNLAISVTSFLMGISVICELLAEKISEYAIAWQGTALKIVGVLTFVFFIAFAVEPFIKFKLPKITMAIPTTYYILRIICDFSSIAALAIISENLLLMFTYCAMLLFMLQFAKLYNRLDSEKNFKKLLATGLVSIMLGFTQTVPHIILKISIGNALMHTPFITNLSVFFTSVFITAFIFSHFSYKNACLNSDRENLLDKLSGIINKRLGDKNEF